MACSNNVVRAGLTPKAIDKETLIDMLTYEYVMLCKWIWFDLIWFDLIRFDSAFHTSIELIILYNTIQYHSLLTILIPRCGPVEILHASAVDDHYSTITTPAKEFMIEVMVVKKGETYTIPVIDVPRVLICYDGEGRIGQLDVK